MSLCTCQMCSMRWSACAFLRFCLTLSPSFFFAGGYFCQSLVVQTYQKPHDRYLYIHIVSFHRPHIFAAFIRAELLQYAVTNTIASNFAAVAALFWQRLVDRGYAAAQLRPIFARVQHAMRTAYLSNSSLCCTATNLLPQTDEVSCGAGVRHLHAGCLQLVAQKPVTLWHAHMCTLSIHCLTVHSFWLHLQRYLMFQ